MRTILIVDGICHRGLGIIRYLYFTGDYHILVFTRSTTCAGATAASSLPNVTLLLNRCSSGYDLSTFIAATQRCPSILICSSDSNSDSREGVQWGARLVQSAGSAGARHIVFLTMERERKQCSTDNLIHTQSKSPMAWTIIRSPPTATSPSSQPNECSLSASQLRNLASYVTWAFSLPQCSSGLDFVFPTATESSSASTASTGDTPKHRDSRTESATPPMRPSYRIGGVHPHPASQNMNSSFRTSRPAPSRSGSSARQAAYLDSGRAKAIQQWVAKTSPVPQASREEEEEEGEDESEAYSGSETE